MAERVSETGSSAVIDTASVKTVVVGDANDSTIDSVTESKAVSNEDDMSADALVEVDVMEEARVTAASTLSLTNCELLCITLATDPVSCFPFSVTTRTLSAPFSRSTALREGKNRVHQKASLTPLSITLCLMMKKTTRMKKERAARIRRRSSQSECSRAVMSCLEVRVAVERRSCWTVTKT